MSVHLTLQLTDVDEQDRDRAWHESPGYRKGRLRATLKHLSDCGGQTTDPPCGGCDRCTREQSGQWP